MTLNQYYDSVVKKNGFKSWNHYCASVSEAEKKHLKKLMKRDYKELKNEPR